MLIMVDVLRIVSIHQEVISADADKGIVLVEETVQV